MHSSRKGTGVGESNALGLRKLLLSPRTCGLNEENFQTSKARVSNVEVLGVRQLGVSQTEQEVDIWRLYGGPT